MEAHVLRRKTTDDTLAISLMVLSGLQEGTIEQKTNNGEEAQHLQDRTPPQVIALIP